VFNSNCFGFVLITKQNSKCDNARVEAANQFLGTSSRQSSLFEGFSFQGVSQVVFFAGEGFECLCHPLAALGLGWFVVFSPAAQHLSQSLGS
jgi:hypothetical protein